MWKRAKSRRRYLECSEKRDASAIELQVLGAPEQDCSSGSHEFLAEVLEQVSVQNQNGSKSGAEAYCGLSTAEPFGGIDPKSKSALIHVGTALVPGVLAASKCFQASDNFRAWLLRNLTSLGDEEAQAMMDDMRDHAIRYIQRAMGVHSSFTVRAQSWKTKEIASFEWTGEWADYVEADYEGFFDAFDNEDSVNLTRAAVTWTICHELAHELSVDGAAEPDKEARAELFHRVREIFPQDVEVAENPSHSNEYACDLKGFEIVHQGRFTPERKYNVWPASVLYCAVIALHEQALETSDSDGEHSDTHPNPFDRAALARLAFIEFLDANNAYIGLFDSSNKFSMTPLNDVTNAFVFTRLLAGEYSADNLGVREYILGDHLKLLIDLFKT